MQFDLQGRKAQAMPMHRQVFLTQQGKLQASQTTSYLFYGVLDTVEHLMALRELLVNLQITYSGVSTLYLPAL